MGYMNILMDENKPKNHPTNRMKFFNNCIIVVRMTKIVEIWFYSY